MNTAVEQSDALELQEQPFNPGALAARDHQALAVHEVPASTTPADLVRIAMQTGSSLDLDRMERLMNMQIQWEAREAKRAFVCAMAAFKSEPLEIFKRKEVDFKTKDGQRIKYKYAELSEVTDAITPVMAKHGLSFRWDIQQEGRNITVHCIVTHLLGHSEQVSMSGAPDESGKKNAIQQVASTVQYLQRYTLLAATGMSTKGDDDDGAGGAPGDEQRAQTPEQPRAPQKVYDQATFEANFPDWEARIKSGKYTAERMVAFLSTKAQFTEEQKQRLMAVKPDAPQAKPTA